MRAVGWTQGYQRALYHALMYTQHGGSGYAVTPADLDAVEVPELVDMLERLAQSRRRDAAAMQRRPVQE